MSQIKFKRGVKKSLPTHLPLGEPAFCTDTGELFIGLGTDRPLMQVKDPSVLPMIAHLEKTIEALILEAGGDSNAEVVDARIDRITGEQYSSLGARLDAMNEDYKAKYEEVLEELLQFRRFIEKVSVGVTIY